MPAMARADWTPAKLAASPKTRNQRFKSEVCSNLQRKVRMGSFKPIEESQTFIIVALDGTGNLDGDRTH